MCSVDIKDATDLPSQLNYDIGDLIKHISDKNKKYLLVSLLKINIKVIIYINDYEKIDLNTDMNYLINLFLIRYDKSIKIYPTNLNIIHFIIFNKLNVYDVLFFLIKMYYSKMSDISILKNSMEIYTWYTRHNTFDTCHKCEKLILNICNSYDDNNVNMLFNHNYTDLLFNGPSPTISDEISILTDKINNLQIQTDNYYKLNEEYNINKTKIIDDINQLNLNYNENKTEIMNEISILTDKINNVQIQTDYHYNKINEDIILIKNEIINENNINNNKLINEITLLTTKINDSQTQNNYYYNKIKILENNTYTLNIILLIIIIFYFLIIFIISTLLILNYNNIMINEVPIYYYKKYIYTDNNPTVKLQLLN
uniref:Uncharacterized protein n=1 Tax=viral metagenome TaxID=1070528 RepID=A0A6C0H8E0_9ZZZZ